MATVTVRIGEKTLEASPECPVVFGRGDETGVVGLDPRDMGISGRAGSIEFAWGVWWVTNMSRTRPLVVEATPPGPPIRLECGTRHAVTTPRLAVLVPGAILTHRIEVALPDEAIAALAVDSAVTTGTITLGDLRLSERDRDAMVAVCSGYLQPFPRRDPHPLSYQEAAARLGPPWTKVTVRKQVERLKERLARSGLYFEGAHANHDLAEHLIANRLLGVDDLARLHRGPGTTQVEPVGAPAVLVD